MKNKRIIYGIAAIIILGIVLFVLNLFVGSTSIPCKDVLKVLLQGGDDNSFITKIILNLRLPHAITALMAGAALAVSGLLMQTLFRNPLADPSMLGISSGASLGVGVVTILTGAVTGVAMSAFEWWSTIGVSLAAFIGAVLVLFVMLAFSARVKNITTLIIIGLMIAYLAGSLTDILRFIGRKEDIHAFLIWGMGSFAVESSKILIFSISIIIGLIATFFLSKNLNILLLGEMYAENLGINIRRNSVTIILVSGYLTAIVTAYCGPIAFIGLAIPHIARFVFKSSDHRLLIPATMLIGMDMALFCNLIADLPWFGINLPINAVTAFIGAPVVISVIMKNKK